MPEQRDLLVLDEGTNAEPQPDPWAPPGAKYAQAASIGTGAVGVSLLAGDSSTGDTVENAIALFPDPSHLFASLANILGFQVDASDAWRWGFLLVVLSLALNIFSFALRYFHARAVITAWEERERQRKAKDAQLQASAAASPQGFISG
jgi:hypothetical protein